MACSTDRMRHLRTAAWHALRDWKRFAAVLVLFAVMGFGLSLYLNMPDPQPRERHYVFGGMFFAFALWLGLAWTGLVEAAREALRGRWRGLRWSRRWRHDATSDRLLRRQAVGGSRRATRCLSPNTP